MKKIEFLSASLPYGLKCITHASNNVKRIVSASFGNRIFFRVSYENQIDYPLPPQKILPIIRPLDSLTKECVQADYNGGKPFVPIIELLEIELEKSVCRKYWKPTASHIEWKAVAWKAVNRTSCFGYNKRGAFFHTECGEYQYLYNYEKLFQQLLKWHFWPNMPENEEVVYVTDEFNPYK